LVEERVGSSAGDVSEAPTDFEEWRAVVVPRAVDVDVAAGSADARVDSAGSVETVCRVDAVLLE
jgi:hypothetical protein